MASRMVDGKDVTAELLQSLPGIHETRGTEEATISEAANISSANDARDIDKAGYQDNVEASGNEDSEEDTSENVADSTGAGCSNISKDNTEIGGVSQSKNQKKKASQKC